jgi:hypothetical protein
LLPWQDINTLLYRAPYATQLNSLVAAPEPLTLSLFSTSIQQDSTPIRKNDLPRTRNHQRPKTRQPLRPIQGPPQIRASPREYELIELILYETASNNYFKSYQLIAEQVFKRAIDVKSSMRIPPAIRASIRKGHRVVAEDLVTRILEMAHPEPRRFLMVCAFHCAVGADDTGIVERILQEDIPYAEFVKALSGAAECCSMEVMTLLLDDLLDDKKTRSRAAWIEVKTEEDIEHTIHLLQA